MTEEQGGYTYSQEGELRPHQGTDTPAPGTPTQVAHPGKAVLRTFVAAGVGIVLAWLFRVLGIDLMGLEGAIVDALTAAVWTVVTGLIQWALTRPGLMPFWRAIGLGTGVENERLG